MQILALSSLSFTSFSSAFNKLHDKVRKSPMRLDLFVMKADAIYSLMFSSL